MGMLFLSLIIVIAVLALITGVSYWIDKSGGRQS